MMRTGVLLVQVPQFEFPYHKYSILGLFQQGTIPCSNRTSANYALSLLSLAIEFSLPLSDSFFFFSSGEGQTTVPLSTRMSAEALVKHTSDGSQQSSESKTGPQSVTSRGYRGSTATAKAKFEGHGLQRQQQLQLFDQAGSQVRAFGTQSMEDWGDGRTQGPVLFPPIVLKMCVYLL